MAKQIHFKHKNGAIKSIPGISARDASPRMVQGTYFDNNKQRFFEVLVRDENHVVKINLLDDSADVVALSAVEEKLPQPVKERIIERRANEYENNVRYNEQVIAAVKRLEVAGEVEAVEVKEVTPEDILADGAITIDISEIALADHLDRGIPIPDVVMKANSEKIKAFEASRKVKVASDPAPAPSDPPSDPDPKPKKSADK